MLDVIVVGAGLAGLTAAWRLQQAGLRVRILEDRDQPGGHVRTFAQDGFLLENGPSSFPASAAHLWRLARELNLLPEVVRSAPAARQRYVVRDCRLALLPSSPWAFLRTPLLGWTAKARLLLEPLIPRQYHPHESAWSFFQRRFGREAATYVAGPFISGIYAGDPHRLGARTAFAKFWSFEQEAGSMILGGLRYLRRKQQRMRAEGQRRPQPGLYTFRGGLGALTSRLAGRLGRDLRCGAPVRELARSRNGYRVAGPGWEASARRIVLALPPAGAGRLLGQVAPAAALHLARVPLAAVAVAHWALPEAWRGFPDGFGFLAPRAQRLRVLGTLFRSQSFPGCAPSGWHLFASFYGGQCDPAAARLDNRAMAELLLQDHGQVASRPLGRIQVLKILRHSGAIPQLGPDHMETIAATMAGLSAAPGLRLAGNYLTGVSMEHAAASGYRAAEAVIRDCAQA